MICFINVRTNQVHFEDALDVLKFMLLVDLAWLNRLLPIQNVQFPFATGVWPA